MNATDPNTPAAAIVPSASWAPPAGIAELYGRPPLVAGEEPDAFHTWLRRVALTIRPEDPFEWVLIKDYVDISWEIVRMRRGKAAMIDWARANHLPDFLSNAGGMRVLSVFRDDPGSEAALLARVGIDRQTFAAGAMGYIIDELEQADRIIAAAEERRNAALKQIAEHRQHLAARLRKSSADIIDAEFEDIRSVEVGAPSHGREMAAVRSGLP